MWDWDLTTDCSGSDERSSSDRIPSSNPSEDSDTESEHSTIAFKCIGVTHDPLYQTVLKNVGDRLRSGEDVNVTLLPEPDQPLCRVTWKLNHFSCIRSTSIHIHVHIHIHTHNIHSLVLHCLQNVRDDSAHGRHTHGVVWNTLYGDGIGFHISCLTTYQNEAVISNDTFVSEYILCVTYKLLPEVDELTTDVIVFVTDDKCSSWSSKHPMSVISC